MNYEIRIPDSKKYIIAVVNVDVTIGISQKIAEEVDIIGKKNNIDRMLFDVRKVRNIESIKPNYEFAFHSLPDPQDYQFKRVAYLVSPHDRSHSVIVGFLQPRGFNIREFYSEKEAVSWLVNEY
jgi:hypothetical protein